MATAPIDLVVGVVVAASALTASTFTAPVPATVPLPAQSTRCAAPAQWETDAQALADALDGVTGDPDADRLRQRLETAGFVPGGAAEAQSGPGDLADLITELLATLMGEGRDAQVVVIGPDGQALETTTPGEAADACPGG
jgi:hypothetical protein